MKIAIFAPESAFTADQIKDLHQVGLVHFLPDWHIKTTAELLTMAAQADVIAVDPDPLGGFEKAPPVLTAVMEALPNLKAVCLSTTSYGWIDQSYCQKRGIVISNVPGYSRESVAEHTLGLLLALAKQIILTDRRTQVGKYVLEKGFELRGKTLGIIGLGSIGTRVAELGQAIGMRVVAFNRTLRTIPGVELLSLADVIKKSDALALHLKDDADTKGIIGQAEIQLIKPGAIVVNTASRGLVDEAAMAKALASGAVAGYAYEAEDLENSPLAAEEKAIGLKGFGWYTTEALANLYQIWVGNIVSAAAGRPEHTVKL